LTDELEMVPEKNFWERSRPVLPVLPRGLKRLYVEVERRFGREIASLVIMAYREWGDMVARRVAEKLLSFDSFDDLVEHLKSRAWKLGFGREIVSSLLYSYQFSHLFDELMEERKHACPEARKEMMRLFQFFVERGQFYSATCIRAIAEYNVGCADRVPYNCKSAYRAYRELTG